MAEIKEVVKQSTKYSLNTRDTKSVVRTILFYLAGALLAAAAKYMQTDVIPNLTDVTLLSIAGAVLAILDAGRKFFAGPPATNVEEMKFGGPPPEGYMVETGIKKIEIE